METPIIPLNADNMFSQRAVIDIDLEIGSEKLQLYTSCRDGKLILALDDIRSGKHYFTISIERPKNGPNN